MRHAYLYRNKKVTQIIRKLCEINFLLRAYIENELHFIFTVEPIAVKIIKEESIQIPPLLFYLLSLNVFLPIRFPSAKISARYSPG